MDKANFFGGLIAFYSSALIGIFQAEGMAELAVAMKNSAQVISHREATKRVVNIKIITVLTAVFISLIGAFESWNEFDYFFVPTKDIPDWRETVSLWITPSVLIFVSVALSCAVCYLLRQLERYFKSMLKDEGFRIKSIFVVFTLAYLSRAVTYVFV